MKICRQLTAYHSHWIGGNGIAIDEIFLCYNTHNSFAGASVYFPHIIFELFNIFFGNFFLIIGPYNVAPMLRTADMLTSYPNNNFGNFDIGFYFRLF